MSNSKPVKNGLIPAGAKMMSAWIVNDGRWVRFREVCLVVTRPTCSATYGGDGFKI